MSRSRCGGARWTCALILTLAGCLSAREDPAPMSGAEPPTEREPAVDAGGADAVAVSELLDAVEAPPIGAPPVDAPVSDAHVAAHLAGAVAEQGILGAKGGEASFGAGLSGNLGTAGNTGLGAVGYGQGGGGVGLGGLGSTGAARGDVATGSRLMARIQGGSSTGLQQIPDRFTKVIVPADVGPAGAETWEGTGVNGWVDAAEDRVSTFSVDVDTASYSRTRRQLRSGYLPPNDMIRVEELVNYVPYDYRPPTDGRPFAVHFEAAPSPFHDDRLVARVGVQARKVADEDAKPAHLTFLVDVSCSMGGADRIGLVRESLTMLADELGDGDTVAIVTYAGGSRTVLEPTPATERATVKAAIASLEVGGSTAMAQGLLTAYALAERSRVPGHVNRVVVASDGDANVGPTSAEDMLTHIRKHAANGITLTTLGYGTGNYRDHRMERLANEGDGNYFYIDGRSEARRVLVDRMRSTIEHVAKDVKLQVDWDPAVVARYRLVGFENRDIADADFRVDAVDAGEIGAGHQVTAVYELQLKPGATADPGVLRMRYKAPGPDAPAAEVAYALPARQVRSVFEEASPDARVAVGVAWFAEVLRDSEHARDVSLTQVEQVLRQARRAEYAEDDEVIELVGRARALGGDGVAVR